jgi:2-C-methyl-D-erythritol 4-phosphate cytidylyltransferase
MKIWVIIVAGGIGKRMQAELPKQFLEINQKPILIHTLQKFYQTLPHAQFLIVLPTHHHQTWQQIIKKHNLSITHQLVDGGAERFYSVKNALNQLPELQEESIVLIHDGVRPLVSSTTILNVLNKTIEHDAAIPVVNLTESLRQLSEQGSFHVNRQQYKIVQTPQGFKLSVLKKAYEQAYSNIFTDDASVVEAIGHKVELVFGNPENIKITTPSDLLIAEALIKHV